MKVQVVLCLLFLMFALQAQAARASDGSVYNQWQHGKSVKMDQSNAAYIYTFVNSYTTQCACPYKENFPVVMGFLGVEGVRPRYPVIQAAMNDFDSHYASDGCAATKFTAAVRDTILPPKDSAFMKGCMVVWHNNESVCTCMAGVGRDVYPGFFDLEYTSEKIEAMGIWKTSRHCYK